MFFCQWDENLNSSAVVEAMKLLINSSYVYQIMVRKFHSITKYMIDEKIQAAINK